MFDSLIARLRSLIGIDELLAALGNVSSELQEIKTMMVKQEDFDALKQGLNEVLDVTTALSGQVATLGSDLNSAIGDLESKITAATTPADLAEELGKVRQIASGLRSVSDGLAALDSRARAADSNPDNDDKAKTETLPPPPVEEQPAAEQPAETQHE